MRVLPESGTVVARHRQHALVESSSGERVSCLPQRRKLAPLIGDAVEWTRNPDGTGLIGAILPRRTTLTRVDSRGHCQDVAANLDQLVIVIAPQPAIDWLVLDHYLAAAELGGLDALIVFNKVDLVQGMPAELDDYCQIAQLMATSTRDSASIEALAHALVGKRSALVGQSGVGKSSLINALVGEAMQTVGALSDKTQQGKHTTTASMLYRMSNGAELVDSPGVRQYAPYIAHERDVAGGFREFKRWLGQCRFDNCAHIAEPGCAIKAAVETGSISARRYAGYEHLYALVASLRARREP
jgi:ribosome biogenesis GTPase